MKMIKIIPVHVGTIIRTSTKIDPLFTHGQILIVNTKV